MASPIFISNPSKTFSFWIVLRGIQFSLLSGYRLCQNYSLIWNIYPQLWQIIKLSFSLYVLINGPIYLTNFAIVALNYLFNFHINNHDLIDNLQYVFHNLNLPIFLIGCMRYYHVVDFEQLFFDNLTFIDNTINTHYSAKLKQLPVTSSNQFGDFLSRYGRFYTFVFVIFVANHYPSHVSTLVLSFFSFQTFLDKIGTVPSILLISALHLTSRHYTLKILVGFHASSLLARDLLSPYFDRVNFSNYEKNHWLKSREGILFGLCLTTYCFIYCFPQLSIIFYIGGQLNMAYLIAKVTDEPPTKAHRLINWSRSQLIWNDYEMVDGKFVNDPFIGIPGWFMFI